jgi:hypothetical protein
MNRLLAALCGLIAATAVARAADAPTPVPASTTNPTPAWSVTAASEVRLFSWQSNRGVPVGVPTDGRGGGSEIYIPYALQLVGRPNDDFKIELLGRAGWVWAHQWTSGLSGEVSTATDTVASGTVTYYGFNGIQPFVSINLNIPTGQSSLSGTAANARMDPDLVDIASFGEGWNVGPTVGVSIPIGTDWMVTTSAGYNWRGDYLRDNSLSATIFTPPIAQAPTTVDPGDVLTWYGAVGYQAGPWAAKASGSISWETATTENGAPLYQSGPHYLVTGTVAYTWEKAGVTTLDLSASHADRNKVLFLGMTSLVAETLNTNSNLYRVGIQHLFPLDRFAVGPTASYLFRDRNGYDSTTLQFTPAKERVAVGAIARYAMTDRVTLNARIEGVWIREGDRPAPGDVLFSVLANSLVAATPVPPVTSTGLQLAVGANMKF